MALTSFTSILSSIAAFRPSPASASPPASAAHYHPSAPHPASTGFPRAKWDRGDFGIWPYRGPVDDKHHLCIAARTASRAYKKDMNANHAKRGQVPTGIYLLAVTDKALEM